MLRVLQSDRKPQILFDIPSPFYPCCLLHLPIPQPVPCVLSLLLGLLPQMSKGVERPFHLELRLRLWRFPQSFGAKTHDLMLHCRSHFVESTQLMQSFMWEKKIRLHTTCAPIRGFPVEMRTHILSQPPYGHVIQFFTHPYSIAVME